MLTCSGCGFENQDAARFCGGCGERLAAQRTCPACRTPNPGDHRFCSGCGAALDPAAPQRDPRDYTPRHLAERILGSRAALEGERKRVTVLFADVRESTALASRLDPEEWHRILDRFFEILTEGVHRFEGTVNQYTGDGIMALFGAPIAHEDHAQRACWAALHLQSALRDYGDELRRRGVNLSVRMGLNSGEVVVGKIGDDLRMDYTAQGHAVSVAQRAESLAEAGCVLATAHTAELVEGYFQLRPLGPAALRGIDEPVELFELEGVGPLRTRLDASRAAGFTRFVGRDAELAQLDAALERALLGDGCVVGVVGEAGVGKSRLCDTFAGRVRGRGIPVYEVRCASQASTLSGVATRDLVRSFCGVEESDTPETARRKIAGTLVLLDERFREMLPLVFEFAGLAERADDAAAVDAGDRRGKAVAFLYELTKRRSEREAAVFLVDDLHWIDPESDEFMADVIGATRGTRTLVLANFRPEYHAEWMSGGRYQQVPLRPFGRAESEMLLDVLLGRDASLAGVRERVLERAGGNPFFTEELAKSLLEAGVIAGERGACRLVAEPGAVAIPDTVHGVLAARMDRLPEREKSLLQTAAVIGREFSFPVLESVSDLAPGELASALDSLLRAEFVHEERLYPQAEYRFKHALTQEVAYEGQLREARRGTHARVAWALAAHSAATAEPRSGEVALHLERAGSRASAARWYARAAEGEGTRLSQAAGRYWEKVLENSVGSDDPETLALRLRAFGGALFGRWAMQRVTFEEDQRLFEEGLSLAERLGDKSAQIMMQSAFALLCFGSGRMSAQIEHLERALALIDAATPIALHVSILQRLAWTHAWFGSAVLAAEYAERGLALGNRDPASDARLLGFNAIVALQASLAHGLLQQGRLAEARAELDRALAMVRDHGDPLSRDICFWTGAELCHVSGDTAGALEFLESARRAAEPLDSDTWLLPTLLYALTYCADDGDWEGVRRAFERGCEILPSDASAGGAYVAIRFLEVVASLEVAPAAAVRRRAEELLTVDSEEDFPRALLNRARLVRALRGREGGAEASRLLDAAEIAMRERAWHADRLFLLADRAELARRCGDAAARDRAMNEAIQLAREIGAPGRAELFERRLAAWRAGG